MCTDIVNILNNLLWNEIFIEYYILHLRFILFIDCDINNASKMKQYTEECNIFII